MNLVERLRDNAKDLLLAGHIDVGLPDDGDLMIEAADRIEALEAALNECLPYIKQANVTAEAKHDNISGQYYMSGCEYEIMQETDLLMQKIAALNKGKDQ